MLTRKRGIYNKALQAELATNGYKQIHRNFLLTYAYAVKDGFDHFTYVVIYPEEGKLSKPMLVLMSGLLIVLFNNTPTWLAWYHQFLLLHFWELLAFSRRRQNGPQLSSPIIQQ